MPLLCDRKHAKEVDFANSRFVVAKSCGVNAGGHRYEYGDEIPEGTLTEEALRRIYEPPLHLIETIEFAVREPQLLDALLRRGVGLPVPEEAKEPEEEATEMCTACGAFCVSLDKHACEAVRKEIHEEAPAKGRRRK